MSLKGPNKRMSRRIAVLAGMFVVIGFGVVIGRLFYMQVINYQFYQEQAVNNQTSDKIITPKRGTIYDRNMKELAVSASAEMVTVDPKKVEDSEKVSKKLSEILEINYETVLKKTQKDSSYQIIKKGVEKDTADLIREFIKEDKIKGITLVEDSKRYYPYGNFASNIIGFTGYEGDGLYGVEAKYNDILKGEAGRVVKPQNASGKDMPFEYEKYIAAEDGDGVVLTIDEGVQHFLEKHLETALEEHQAGNGVAGIVMDVKTGEILAMASKPDFDINSPYEIDTDSLFNELRNNIDTVLSENNYSSDAVGSEFLQKGTTAAISESIDEETFKEIKKARSAALEKMWRNKPIQDLYEPGSTFKLFTMSSALEEGAVTENDRFFCPGYKIVADTRIRCWKKGGHGSESLIESLQNSCNPALMEIGLKLGTEEFRKYFQAFGMLSKTGIDLPGEAQSIFHKEENFGQVDLATASFGQNFSVTPIQLITMVSAIVDDGKLKTPHVVKEIVDSDGNVKETVGTDVIRQVISEETSKFMREAMESVVTVGTAKKAYVAGYRVGGKTGTSEKYPRGNGKYVSSFIGVAPMDDPQYAVLIMIDEPIGGARSGGGMASAPAVGRIMEDILPYLGVEAVYSEEEMARRDVIVPNTIGMTKSQVEKLFKDKDIKYKIFGEDDTVTDQIPSAGVKVPATAEVIIYMGETKPTDLVSVPNVRGLSVKEATRVLKEKGLYLKVTGVSSIQMTSGTIAERQSIEEGTKVNIGTVVTVVFANNQNLGE